MKLIDAEALERDGWHMSRTVRVDKDTMELQTRKPTDFTAIEDAKPEVIFEDLRKYCEKRHLVILTREFYNEMKSRLLSAQPDSLVRPSARWMNVGHKRARICSSCFRDEPYKFAIMMPMFMTSALIVARGWR